jgi:crossover junction endodeoxyribonuclease RuvC
MLHPDWVIGIDPGSKGVIGVINADKTYTKLINLEPMTEQDIAHAFKKLGTLQNAVAYLEKVGAMPGQGVTSMFNFGKNYGFLRGQLVANGIPFYDVSPQVWQRGVGMGKSYGSKALRKKAAKQQAEQWFPVMKFTQETADGMLIAVYGHRQHYPVK